MTKNIAAICLAIMVLAQIGAAHHNTVHIAEHSHHEHYDAGHEDGHTDDHQENTAEACQLCLLTTSLSFAMLPEQLVLPAPLYLVERRARHSDSAVMHDRQALYNPRAPPSFLI